jgi:hypothetical protein
MSLLRVIRPKCGSLAPDDLHGLQLVYRHLPVPDTLPYTDHMSVKQSRGEWSRMVEGQEMSRGDEIVQDDKASPDS